MSKTKKIVIIAVMLMLLIIPTTVFAVVVYNSDKRENTFDPAEANIQVREDDVPLDDLDDEQQRNYTLILNSSNNYSVEKKVAVYDPRNKIDEILRVRFVPMWYDSSNNICGGINERSSFCKIVLNEQDNTLRHKNAADQDILIMHLDENWKEYWTYQDDCFYCKEPIKAGNLSADLLTSVEVPADVYSEMTGYSLKIDVLADAIQEYGASNIRW